MEYFRVKTTSRPRNNLQKALLIARREIYGVFDWDDGLASRLYRTEGGEYFEVLKDPNLENDVVIPISFKDAIDWFEDSTTETIVEFQQAFPNSIYIK